MGLGFVFLGMNYNGRYRRNAYSCLAAAHHIPSVDVIPESITSCDDYVGRQKLGGDPRLKFQKIFNNLLNYLFFTILSI
jgi:hypothetical protein